MNKALTMIELIIVIGIVSFALIGLLVSYISSLNLNEYDRNLTIAMNIAREKMEELYNYRTKNFDNLGADMCGSEPSERCLVSGTNLNRVVSFRNAYMQTEYNNFNGSCTIYIKDIDPELDNLREARVVVCWRLRLGRIIGEDTNLNGVLDPGEDAGGHTNELDSPCELISAFTKR